MVVVVAVEMNTKFASARINNATHKLAHIRGRQHNNIECIYVDRGGLGVSLYVKIIIRCTLEAKI